MNAVPHRYRNLINPWQTEREIRSAVRFLDRMLARCDEAEKRAICQDDWPDRDWRTPK